MRRLLIIGDGSLFTIDVMTHGARTSISVTPDPAPLNLYEAAPDRETLSLSWPVAVSFTWTCNMPSSSGC